MKTLEPDMSMAKNPAVWEMTQEALEEKDGGGFMAVVGNELRPRHLWNNMHLLKSLGMFEDALALTFTTTWTSPASRASAPLPVWRFFFSYADRKRLLSCGDPLPGPGPFTLYRGVCGRGAARRVRGFSWTGKRECARWFAGVMAYGEAGLGLPDPAVFEATVPKSAVLFYTNDRNEDEFVILPDEIRPRRIERVTRKQFELVQEKKTKEQAELLQAWKEARKQTRKKPKQKS